MTFETGRVRTKKALRGERPGRDPHLRRKVASVNRGFVMGELQPRASKPHLDLRCAGDVPDIPEPGRRSQLALNFIFFAAIDSHCSPMMVR